jgi:hypothetical protein
MDEGRSVFKENTAGFCHENLPETGDFFMMMNSGAFS